MTAHTRAAWEILADKGKYIEAAELLVASTNNPGKAARTSSRETDYFHAGQCYAFAGKDYYKQAITHMVRAHKADRPERNMYVMATICFLRGDAIALGNAVEELKKFIPSSSKNYGLVSVAETLLAHAKKGDFSYVSAYPKA